MVTVEVIKQPPKVMHGIEDVGKSIVPIPKAATAVTTHEKLIVVPLPTVSKVAATVHTPNNGVIQSQEERIVSEMLFLNPVPSF
jgi:hypothetical protein